MNNSYRKDNKTGITYIECNYKGTIQYMLIDNDDLPLLESYSGTIGVQYDKKIKNFYAVIRIPAPLNNGVRKKVSIHRIIMNPATTKDCIDHRNWNSLDNRKCNLRIVSDTENKWNKKNTKGYSKKGNRYQAAIAAHGVKHYIGVYDTEQEAREAYLVAKSYYHIIGGSN